MLYVIGAERLHDVAFILGIDTSNDVFFVAKVLIEITGADTQMSCNVIGCNRAFTVFIKQLKTGFNNSIFSFH